MLTLNERREKKEIIFFYVIGLMPVFISMLDFPMLEF